MHKVPNTFSWLHVQSHILHRPQRYAVRASESFSTADHEALNNVICRMLQHPPKMSARSAGRPSGCLDCYDLRLTNMDTLLHLEMRESSLQDGLPLLMQRLPHNMA
jgi:hypothetical protein